MRQKKKPPEPSPNRAPFRRVYHAYQTCRISPLRRQARKRMLSTWTTTVSATAAEAFLEHVLSRISGIEYGVPVAQHPPELLRVGHCVVGGAGRNRDRIANACHANLLLGRVCGSDGFHRTAERPAVRIPGLQCAARQC